MSGYLENVQMYCPNCGQRNCGLKNAKEIVVLQCRKCRCCITSKKMKAKAVITISQQN